MKKNNNSLLSAKNWQRLFVNKTSILAIVIGFQLLLLASALFRQEAIPGADTPFYLAQSQKVLHINHQFLDLNLDRKVVIMVPVVISSVTGLSMATSLKIMLLIIVGCISALSYLVAREVVSDRIAVLAVFITAFSPAFYRLAWDLYANIFGLMMVLTILWCFLRLVKAISQPDWLQQPTSFVKSTLPILVVSVLIGITFQVYGVLAMASFGLFAPAALYVLYRYQQKFKWGVFPMVVVGLSFLVLLGLPLSLAGPQLVWNGFFKPIVNRSLSQQLEINHQSQVAPWVDENHYTILDFPLNRQIYLIFYSPTVLMTGAVGLLLLLIRKPRASEKVLFLSFVGLFFGLTQQNYFGLSWLVDRFILMIFPFIAIGIGAVFDQIHELLTSRNFVYWQKLIFYAVLITLLATPDLSKVTRDLTESFTPTISKQEYSFISTIPTLSLPGHNLYSVNTRHYWIEALAPGLNYQPVEYYATCGDLNVKSRLTTNDWLKGYAFSKKSSLSESLSILADQSQNQPYYILISEDETCGAVSHFLNSHYELVKSEESLFLLQRVYENQF